LALLSLAIAEPDSASPIASAETDASVFKRVISVSLGVELSAEKGTRENQVLPKFGHNFRCSGSEFLTFISWIFARHAAHEIAPSKAISRVAFGS
jgi:hypothetical protein